MVDFKECDRENLIKKISEFKKTASSKEKIEKLVFFGSRASGKPNKWSDVDLIVVSRAFEKEKCGRGAWLRKFWDLDYPVDFVCYTPEEFKHLEKRISIVSHALKNG